MELELDFIDRMMMSRSETLALSGYYTKRGIRLVTSLDVEGIEANPDVNFRLYCLQVHALSLYNDRAALSALGEPPRHNPPSTEISSHETPSAGAPTVNYSRGAA